jgi:hypothetical protein
MNLRPENLYFGVAPAILIDCARRLVERRAPFGLVEFAQAIGTSVREAEPVLEQMRKDGFFKRLKPGSFESTDKLSQLANAKISEGISRAEAEKLLALVLRKAEEINANHEQFPCSVGCVAVFGSFLGSKARLGDLDLGVYVEEPPRRSREEAFAMVRDMLRGRPLPASKTFAALRLRQPKKISLHELREVIDLGTPYRVVFGEVPESLLTESNPGGI